MSDKKRRKTVAKHVRELRLHLLAILDWMEDELDSLEPRQADTSALLETLGISPEDGEAEPLTDRHYWVLTQLGQGVRLTRKHVMEYFGYSERHAKRIISALTRRGLIQFHHAPKPGHYVFCNGND
ncbi:MAG: hypothetical protein ISS69_11150 [Phycisphaerae bacterium]|nr:hypothetical protein [Phycisphaerae bacterium]